LLDFDRQWERHPGFVFYDFNQPEELPPQLRAAFDFILIDPPFITREVWEKYATTAGFLARDGARLVCTTIAENQALMVELLGVRPVLFRPSIPSLVYQYSVYTNYASEHLDQLNPEVDDQDWRPAAAVEVDTAAVTADGELRQLPLPGEGKAPPLERGDAPLTEATEPLPVPPEAMVLMELRECLGALKRALEAMQAPLQRAVRRRAAVSKPANDDPVAASDAASAATATAGAAIDAARATLDGLEVFLAKHESKSVGDASFTKAWSDSSAQLREVRELLSTAHALDSVAACHDFGQRCRRISTALFRQSNMLLDRIKALRTQPGTLP